jgi:RHS repeat-associated protein
MQSLAIPRAQDPLPGKTNLSENPFFFCYEWTVENQLKRVTKDGIEVATFKYDSLGRRVEKKIAGGFTYSYLYDGMDILRETRSDGTTYTYVHGPGIDEPLARIDQAGAVAYYHADALGSIVKMTDSAGAVVQSRQYDAWGNLEIGADQPGYAFTGREWDPETGLYYYRARYYSPREGRFVSEDPFGIAFSSNQYTYVGNRPIIMIDAYGLKEYYAIVVSGQGGLGFFGGEVGKIHALDPDTGIVHNYTYAGAGVGLGFGGSVNIEIGSIDMDNPDDILKWGLAAGGFIAAGPKGLSGSYGGTSFFGNGSYGATAGWAGGAGGGVGGIITHT